MRRIVTCLVALAAVQLSAPPAGAWNDVRFYASDRLSADQTPPFEMHRRDPVRTDGRFELVPPGRWVFGRCDRGRCLEPDYRRVAVWPGEEVTSEIRVTNGADMDVIYQMTVSDLDVRDVHDAKVEVTSDQARRYLSWWTLRVERERVYAAGPADLVAHEHAADPDANRFRQYDTVCEVTLADLMANVCDLGLIRKPKSKDVLGAPTDRRYYRLTLAFPDPDEDQGAFGGWVAAFQFVLRGHVPYR